MLGSGWSETLERCEVTASLSYADIPCLGATGVAGHAGFVRAARLGTLNLLVFQGRRHWYEGIGWEPIAFPVFLSRALGASVLVLTNAAGGLRPDLKAGDLMVIRDHINAMGSNPLIGPHDPVWGARFPDLSEVYDHALRKLFDAAAARVGQNLHHGVYLAASGPTYETPAEVRAFQALGADAVGMSTVPEAILARAAGLRVAAISCISNPAAGLGAGPLTHEDVIRTVRQAVPRMQALLAAFFAGLAADLSDHERSRSEARA
jgi:purine-nucleoside phosphorylase